MAVAKGLDSGQSKGLDSGQSKERRPEGVIWEGKLDCILLDRCAKCLPHASFSRKLIILLILVGFLFMVGF